MDELENGQWVTVENEFATVHIAVDRSANGPCLVVVDPASGREIALDPLELQALAWARHEHLSDLLAPAFKEQYLHRVKPADVQQYDAGIDPSLEEYR